MDTGSGKAIELILIVAVVLGFYFQQRAALDRAKKQDQKESQGQGDDRGNQPTPPKRD